ncbi:DNA polymerase subunit Cdc27 [Gongronella butleri]|nr:DNA polymerase subunit Cdc27 [Gongronella butleri]
MADIASFLDTSILHEKKPVTFKALSRALQLHVNTAKQALYDYASTQESVVAVYCVSGIMENKSKSVALVSQADLEDAKHQFEHVTGMHVYCLMPSSPKGVAPLVQANHDLAQIDMENRIKSGMIRNKLIEKRAPAKQSAASSAVPPKPAPAHAPKPSPLTAPKQPAPSKTTKPAKSARATKPEPATKRKGTLNFDGHKTKKQAIASSDTEKPMPSATRKPQVIQESDEDNDDEDEEEDEEALDARLARSATLQSKDDFFSDDDEDVNEDKDKKMVEDAEDHEMRDAQPTTPEFKPSLENASDKDDNDDVPGAAATSPSNISSSVQRRKVQKKKTYKNDQGYLVTEDVWEWEEVPQETMASNASPTPAEKTSTPETSRNTPSSNKKAPAEQRSLLSFWGKR